MYESPKEDLGHPDAAIRLASAVHRFKVPTIEKTVSFQRSFKTTGSHALTKKSCKEADEHRKKLQDALKARTLSGERIYSNATRYLPLIHQILLSCKVQPESARLDERLMFQWKSGLEKDPEKFTSEALMYDMVMTLSCQAEGKALIGTECSMAGEFTQASREYAIAAGIYEYLGKEHLPQWIAKGTNVEDTNLPTECSVAACEAMTELMCANGQQMAVATVMIKPGTPNYGLLAKLLLGCHARLEKFTMLMRKSAQAQKQRMDPEVFTLLAFSTAVMESLSNYFYARSKWEDNLEYGLAIALLAEARNMIATRKNGASKGVPEIPKKGSPLTALQPELNMLKTHYTKLLQRWETDNSSVYFERVPPKVPESSKLTEPVFLVKPKEYVLDEVEPLPLALPASGATPGHKAHSSLTRSDSDLARELQAKMNAGEA